MNCLCVRLPRQKNIVVKPSKNIPIRSPRLTYQTPKQHGQSVLCNNHPATQMLLETSYYVGKSIMLFTMFYCGMNWYHYRSLNEDSDENNNRKNKK